MPETLKTADDPLPHSPTGTPILPPVVAKWALPIVAIAAALAMAPDMGIALPVAVISAAKLVVLVGTLLGIASPGARK